MKNAILTILTVAILSACGGGDDVDDMIQGREKSYSVDSASGKPSYEVVNRFLDFAQGAYDNYFTCAWHNGPRKNTCWENHISGPYIYRYYGPDKGNYLGVDGNIVRVYGKLSNFEFLTVGYLRDFPGYDRRAVIKGYENCSALDYPWQTPISPAFRTSFRFCLNISEDQPTDFTPVTKANQ